MRYLALTKFFQYRTASKSWLGVLNYTIQCIIELYTLTYIILLTSVTPINSVFLKKEVSPKLYWKSHLSYFSLSTLWKCIFNIIQLSWKQIDLFNQFPDTKLLPAKTSSADVNGSCQYCEWIDRKHIIECL